MFDGSVAFRQGVWCSPSWNQISTTIVLPYGNRVLCCNPGTFYATNLCTKCALGQYTNTLNLNSSCTTCAKNSIAPETGLTACGDCATGTFSNDGESCATCSAGTFMYAGDRRTDCLPCVPGKYQDVVAQDHCLNCPIGWYQKNEKKPFCLPCVRKFSVLMFVVQILLEFFWFDTLFSDVLLVFSCCFFF